MIPADIIAKALLDTSTDSDNYDPATVGIEALNIVSDEVNNEVVQVVKEDYFWDRLKVDTIDLQNEYNITTAWITWDWVASTSVNVKKVNKIFIKYATTDTYYTRLTYQNPDTLEKDLEYYADNQSKTAPFYYIQDRSIFIYPAPTPWITQWLKMNAIYTPPAIALASPETWLPLQPDKHYIYALWLAEHIYKSQGKLQEANNARTLFKQELISLMTYLKSRSNAPKMKTISGLDKFR